MRVLYLACRDPYADHRAQELLDALLVAAAFGAEVGVLFEGDGVWALHPDQHPMARSSLGAQLDALPLYDVTALHVLASDLAARGLQASDLRLPVQVHAPADLPALIAAHDQVIRL